MSDPFSLTALLAGFFNSVGQAAAAVGSFIATPFAGGAGSTAAGGAGAGSTAAGSTAAAGFTLGGTAPAGAGGATGGFTLGGGTVAGGTVAPGQAIAFEFTGAAQGGLLGGGAAGGALGSVVTAALAPSVNRPALSSNGEAGRTVELPAVPVRYVLGLRKVGMVLCYFAERNVAESKIRKAEGLRSFHRCMLILPSEFAGASPGVSGVPSQYVPFWPTAEGSGSIGVYAGMLCAGQAGQPKAAWFGGAEVPGAWSNGAFLPSGDGEQRKWRTGYKVLGNQDDDIYDDEGELEPGVVGLPEVLMIFGDGTYASNVEGVFGKVMRAMTGPRAYRLETKNVNDYSFTPPGKADIHQLYDSKTQRVDADYELNDWIGTPDNLTINRSDPRWPKWDITHTAKDVSMLGVLGASRHQNPGPGVLDGAEILLPGPQYDFKPLHQSRGEDPIDRNAADARRWFLTHVRKIPSSRICQSCYEEARYACSDWMEHRAVSESERGAGTVGRKILEATYGVGTPPSAGRVATGWMAKTNDEQSLAIRYWNRAYAGRRNADIRYPADGVIESPGPNEVAAIAAALDDCWLGRVVEYGNRIHFRPGFKRPAKWSADADDLASEPDFTVIPVESQIIDAVQVELPQCRNIRHQNFNRQYLRDPANPGGVVNAAQGPQMAFVTGAQHANRLSRAMIKRTDPALIRFSVVLLLGDGQVRKDRMATFAGDAVELELAPWGLPTRRYEVAAVDRSGFRRGVIGLQLAEEPATLWDDEWDYQSPILDERLREQDLGVIVPHGKPPIDLIADNCIAPNYGYPGQRLRIDGLLWDRWWMQGWPQAGTGGVVASANAVQFIIENAPTYRAVRTPRSTDNPFLTANIDPALIDGGYGDVYILGIRVQTSADNSIQTTLNLARRSHRGAGVDFVAALEPNLAWVFRDVSTGNALAVFNDEDTGDSYFKTYAAGTVEHAALVGFFRLPFTFQGEATYAGVYDVAIVDRRARCFNDPQSPWFRIPEDLAADSGGPYEGRITRRQDFSGIPIGIFGSYRIPFIQTNAVINLTGQGLGGSGGYSYAWSDIVGNEAEAGFNPNQQAIQLTYSETGRFSALLTVTDSNGDAADAVADILILGETEPRLSVSIDAPKTAIAGEEITLSAIVSGTESSSGLAFRWTANGISIGVGRSIQYMPPEGVYEDITIRLDVSKTLPDGSTLTRYAHHILEILDPDFQVDLELVQGWVRSVDDKGEVSHSAQVRAVAQYGKEPYAYAWSGAGLDESTASAITARFASADGAALDVSCAVTDADTERKVGRLTIPAYQAEALSATISGDSTWQLREGDDDSEAGAVFTASLTGEATGGTQPHTLRWRDTGLPTGIVLSSGQGTAQAVYQFTKATASDYPPRLHARFYVTDSASPPASFEVGFNISAYEAPDEPEEPDEPEPEPFAVMLSTSGWEISIGGGLPPTVTYRAAVTAEASGTSNAVSYAFTPAPTSVSGAVATYSRNTLPTAATTVSVTATAGDQTATASIDIPPLGQVPQPPEQLSATIAAGTWALASGTAGQVGAVFEARPNVRISGGMAPHAVVWTRTGRLVSGGNSRTALYRFTATSGDLYPGDWIVRCTVTDASTPQQSADASARILDYPHRPPPPDPLTATISNVAWGLVSGTAGEAGAVYQAHPTIRVSGGTAPHPVVWASNPLLVSGGTSRTALFRFTASASNPYPAAINVSCTVTDASTPQQSATATGRIAAYPQEPAPPQPPTADLSVVVSAGRWSAVSLGRGIVRYLSSARANADGGSGGYRYLWRVNGALLTSYANAGPYVSLQSFTGGQATVSCTVTDSAGNSISGSAVIPAHGGVNP